MVIGCEGHRGEVMVREVPICPSILCSLASSLEAAVMVDFLVTDCGWESWKCNNLVVPQEDH